MSATFGRRYGDSVWLIIVEHDTDNPFKSDGAIIMEQYTKIDTDTVQERAQGFADSGKYGRVWMVSFNERDCCEIKPKPRDSKHPKHGDNCTFTKTGKCTCGLYPPS